jgi:hypothetical protein
VSVTPTAARLTASRAFGLILSDGHSPANAPDPTNALAAKAAAKIALRLMMRDILWCVMVEVSSSAPARGRPAVCDRANIAARVEERKYRLALMSIRGRYSRRLSIEGGYGIDRRPAFHKARGFEA